jgi:hypothetical protein
MWISLGSDAKSTCTQRGLCVAGDGMAGDGPEVEFSHPAEMQPARRGVVIGFVQDQTHRRPLTTWGAHIPHRQTRQDRDVFAVGSGDLSLCRLWLIGCRHEPE